MSHHIFSVWLTFTAQNRSSNLGRGFRWMKKVKGQLVHNFLKYEHPAQECNSRAKLWHTEENAPACGICSIKARTVTLNFFHQAACNLKVFRGRRVTSSWDTGHLRREAWLGSPCQTDPSFQEGSSQAAGRHPATLHRLFKQWGTPFHSKGPGVPTLCSRWPFSPNFCPKQGRSQPGRAVARAWHSL